MLGNVLTKLNSLMRPTHHLLFNNAPWQLVHFMSFLMHKVNFFWTYPFINIRFLSSKCLSIPKIPIASKMYIFLVQVPPDDSLSLENGDLEDFELDEEQEEDEEE